MLIGVRKCSSNGEARRLWRGNPTPKARHAMTRHFFEEKMFVLRTLDARRGYTFFTALECSQRLFGTKRSRRAMRKKLNTFCEAEKKSHIFESRVLVHYATVF